MSMSKTGMADTAKALHSCLSSIREDAGAMSQEEIATCREALVHWKSVIADVLNYIAQVETAKAQERAKRLQLVKSVILLQATDPDVAQALIAKHNVTPEEIAAVQVKPAGGRTPRRTNGSSSSKYTITDTDGEKVYTHSRSRWELFRSFAKNMKTGHVTGENGKEKFDFAAFRAQVLKVSEDAQIVPGMTFTYAGRTWTYNVETAEE